MRLLTGLVVISLALGCAKSVKRADGSEVPKTMYRCEDGREFGVSLHANVAYLYQGLSRRELARQGMKDGAIVFGDDKASLVYKGRQPELILNGQSWGDCPEKAQP